MKVEEVWGVGFKDICDQAFHVTLALRQVNTPALVMLHVLDLKMSSVSVS